MRQYVCIYIDTDLSTVRQGHRAESEKHKDPRNQDPEEGFEK